MRGSHNHALPPDACLGANTVLGKVAIDAPVGNPRSVVILLNIMIKSQAIQWKATCWIVVGGFAVLSAAFGVLIGRLFYVEHHPELWPRGSFGGPLGCANSVTDPLGAMLGIGTPISLAGVVGFAVLAYRGYATRTSAISAAVLALGCTVALLVFGFRFFRNDLGDMHLSEIVWWLKPFGFFGV
jgi:hypothetical protein